MREAIRQETVAEPYLTVREVGRRYRKSRSVIWNWSRHRTHGFPKPVKIGPRTTRWCLADLLD